MYGAVLAKSFTRIDHVSLIKSGIVTLVFTDPDHYDHFDRDDELEIPKIREGILQGTCEFAVGNRTKGIQCTVRAKISPREQSCLMSGEKLAHVKAHRAQSLQLHALLPQAGDHCGNANVLANPPALQDRDVSKIL